MGEWATGVLSSAIGSLVGVALSLGAARWMAARKAHGQLYTTRRIEVLEGLAELLHETACLMDNIETGTGPKAPRGQAELYHCWGRRAAVARLYVSDELYQEVRVLESALGSIEDALSHGVRWETSFGFKDFERLSEMLAEALAGRHEWGAGDG